MTDTKKSNLIENNSTDNVGAALPNKAQSNNIYKYKYEQTKLLNELFMTYIEEFATNFILSEEKAKELVHLYYAAQNGVDLT